MAKQINNKVPKFRFKGFEGEWKEKTLGDIGDTQSGVGFPDAEQGGKTGTPFFKVSDMSRAGNDQEMLTSNNYVSDEQLRRKKWTPISDVPAVIFAKVGAAIMLNRKRLVKNPFLIDNNAMAYIFDASWDTSFGRTLFDTINLPLYAQVGALPSYNGSDIESIVVHVPDNVEEQTKIGGYFREVDRLIGLQQRKHDKLVTLKKAMLQKMFPQPGATTPEIRFKGFDCEWDGKPFNLITSRATQSCSEENLPRLEYEDIVSNSGYLNKDLAQKKSRKKGIRFEEGDVLFGKLRPYLKNWLLADFEGIAVGDFWVLRSSTTAPPFLYRLIQTEAFERIANQSAGSKMPRSDWNLVSNSVFRVPSDPIEQQQIGSYFLTLDELISKHAVQLAKLKQLKSACLEAMFV